MSGVVIPVTCDCGHKFKIDAVGVQPWTNIVCPSCGKVDHLDQQTVDDIFDQYMDAMGDLYTDESEFQNAMSVLSDAVDRDEAVIVDDGH